MTSDAKAPCNHCTLVGIFRRTDALGGGIFAEDLQIVQILSRWRRERVPVEGEVRSLNTGLRAFCDLREMLARQVDGV